MGILKTGITLLLNGISTVATSGFNYLVTSGIGSSILNTVVSGGTSILNMAISKGTELVNSFISNISNNIVSGSGQKFGILNLLNNVFGTTNNNGEQTSTTQTNNINSLNDIFNNLSARVSNGVSSLMQNIENLKTSIANGTGITKIDLEELDSFTGIFGKSINNIKSFFEKYKLDLDSIKSFLSGESDFSIEESIKKVSEFIDSIDNYSDNVKNKFIEIIDTVKKIDLNNNTGNNIATNTVNNTTNVNTNTNKSTTIKTTQNTNDLNLNTSWFNSSQQCLTYAKRLAVQNGRKEMEASYSNPEKMLDDYSGTVYTSPAPGRIMLIPANTDGAGSVGHAAYVISVNDDYIVVKESNYGDGAAVTENTRKIYRDNISSKVRYV